MRWSSSFRRLIVIPLDFSLMLVVQYVTECSARATFFSKGGRVGCFEGECPLTEQEVVLKKNWQDRLVSKSSK